LAKNRDDGGINNQASLMVSRLEQIRMNLLH